MDLSKHALKSSDEVQICVADSIYLEMGAIHKPIFPRCSPFSLEKDSLILSVHGNSNVQCKLLLCWHFAFSAFAFDKEVFSIAAVTLSVICCSVNVWPVDIGGAIQDTTAPTKSSAICRRIFCSQLSLERPCSHR